MRKDVARGTLFLVVGPSGAGKDTLIAQARAALEAEASYVFLRRIVTRASDANENNVAVSEAQFSALEQAGAFALSWEAHGHRYGVPAQISDELAAGRHVVVNVSRAVVEEARARFSPVRVVHVTAPPTVLAKRLQQRGRETAGAIAARLARGNLFAPRQDGVIILNDKDVAMGAAQLLEALRSPALPDLAQGSEGS